MMHIFEGSTANEVWSKLALEFSGNANVPIQPSRGGATKELLHVMLAVSDPRQRWITSRRPALNPAFAIAEVVWILCGRNDIDFLVYWNAQLPRYVGTSASCHGAYGYRLRRQFGVDQLERAYLALKENPDGRQVVLQIWDPTTDFPAEDGSPVSQDIPCNVMALLKVRNNTLEWMQILRSNDLFKGVPYNIIQFTTLQEILAGWLGIQPGTYNQLSDSLHLYEEDFAHVRKSEEQYLDRNTDSLAMSKTECESALAELSTSMDVLRSLELTQNLLCQLVHEPTRPLALQNLFLVVAAETARRRRWPDLATSVMTECTNPVLVQVWENWMHRFEAV